MLLAFRAKINRPILLELYLELAWRSKYFWCGQSLIGIYLDFGLRQSEIGCPEMGRDR